MRVLNVVTRMNVGGVATLVRELARALPDHGVQATLAIGDVQDGETEVAHLPPGTVRVPGLGRSPAAGDDLRALRSLRRLIRDLQPDVVHTHTAKAGALGRTAATGLPVTRVHTFHGHLLHGYFSPRWTAAVVAAERALAARTHLLISSGERVGQDLRNAGVGRHATWVSIPPGVVAPTPAGVRGRRTVAFVGRLVQVKRPDRLLAVARQLPDVHFLVAGDGPLRALLESAGLPNLELIGWVQDVGAVYGRASAVLLCSDNEAMPLALVEGALCGLPAVTTDAGSALEVVEHGRTGLVSDGDPVQLAAALRALLADGDELARMGDLAQERASRHFTVEAMTAAHAAAYARAVEGRKN